MQTIDRRLIEACLNGDVLTVEQLLQQGANPNTQDDQWPKPTVLLIATEYGYTDIITTLIQYGANPHTQDHFGQTALHYTVKKQYDDITQYLITELKLDPNKKDHWGRTPLMLASANGDIKTIQLLIQHGAIPNTTDHDGRSALHYAIENQQHDIAQYFLTQLKLDPNTPNQHGVTPFMIATQNGDIKIIELLTQHGANPHIRNTWGKSAIHYAIKKQYHDITQYLLTQLKLDPNTQDEDGITPIMIAAQKGDIKIIKSLIQHGADPHIRDCWGKSALHYALEYQNHDTAQYLLTHLQVDPNTQDKNGITPLMIATKNGDIKIIKSLIQHGANPYIQDNRGNSALHYALANQNHSIAQYLLTHLQVDPNSQDHNGITPFLIAIQKGNIKMIQLLIQLGANPYVTDQNGRTALHYAAEYGKPEAVSFLITHLHLNPNAEDHHGNTPLHIAFQNDKINIAQKLIQLGANPHIPNHQGKTPTSIAYFGQILPVKPQLSLITL